MYTPARAVLRLALPIAEDVFGPVQPVDLVLRGPVGRRVPDGAAAAGAGRLGLAGKQGIAGAGRFKPDGVAFFAQHQADLVFAADADAQQALSATTAGSDEVHGRFLCQDGSGGSKRKGGDHPVLFQDQTHARGGRVSCLRPCWPPTKPIRRRRSTSCTMRMPSRRDCTCGLFCLTSR
jgi:hypothetical protein